MPFSKFRLETSEASFNLLKLLIKSWPAFDSVSVDSRQRPFFSIEAVAEAVQWLSDMGFIIYESLIRDGLFVELRFAALTPRGREFLASFPRSWRPTELECAA